jgi:type I restriction-modification system DNA methylase subunit
MISVPVPKRNANMQIGDLVQKAGIYTKPGVVVDKKDDGTVIIDTEPKQIEKYHRYANTSGLTPQEKARFNSIMDEVMDAKDNGERINKLQEQIDQVRTEPEGKRVFDTLVNQQSILIRIAKELPRVYSYDAGKINGY